jgi:8-oxo-dGTP pyrophosphatase MutT (NUDIX family)
MEVQVGVKILLKNSHSLYLFIKRTEPLLDGGGIRWDIPGGRIKAKESLGEALVRELQEETGMGLSGPPVLIAAQDIMVPDKHIHIVRLTYMAESVSDIKLSNEHNEYNWLSLDKALKTNIDDYLREVISNKLRPTPTKN